jgi:hypothetical protein
MVVVMLVGGSVNNGTRNGRQLCTGAEEREEYTACSLFSLRRRSSLSRSRAVSVSSQRRLVLAAAS